MFSLIDSGLQLQTASIGKYYRICGIGETSGALIKEATDNNAILQRKGTRLVISSVLLDGYKRVQLNRPTSSPEAA